MALKKEILAMLGVRGSMTRSELAYAFGAYTKANLETAYKSLRQAQKISDEGKGGRICPVKGSLENTLSSKLWNKRLFTLPNRNNIAEGLGV